MKYYNLLYFQISGGILTNKEIQDCAFIFLMYFYFSQRQEDKDRVGAGD